MKKTYIIPKARIADAVFQTLMFTTSISNVGNGDDDNVDAKKRFYDDDRSESFGPTKFYNGWE